MTTLSAKDIVVTWDGDPVTWADYSRKVRLQWEKTEKKKRHLLGAELASRLSGRAWAMVPSLDHRKLQKRNGTKYLLRFLRDRLCRTAVPDAGARLEELFIKMKRPLGMSMAEWSNHVLECYRKVQRALVRARQSQPSKGITKTAEPSTGTRSEPQAEPPSPARSRRSETTSPTRRTTTSARVRPTEEDEEASERGEYEEVPQEAASEAGVWDWTDEEWRKWKSGKWGKEDDSSETSSGEDLPWDELEVEEIQVLPQEVLGWLLLRKANLSSSNRLSVQSSVQNSLAFEAIEHALRDQEEELLQGDAHRLPQRRRSYWVEEQGVWGLLVSEEAIDDAGAEIHWVGSQLPNDVYHPEYEETAEEEEEEIHWSHEWDGWHGYVQDAYGAWAETDGLGTYWSAEDDWSNLSPEQSKELEEAYSAYEAKAKTFLQSRQFQRSKGQSRGFYPIKMMKGKGKGKSKGKKGKGKGTPKPLFSTQGQHQGDVMSAASSSNNGGCFICGDRGHGFRTCPKRSSQQGNSTMSGKGNRKGTFWIESLTPSSLNTIFMVQSVPVSEMQNDSGEVEEVEMAIEGEIKNDQDEPYFPDTSKILDELYTTSSAGVIEDTTGYGVLDLGATETVCSLEALEGLMRKRSEKHGMEEPVEVYNGKESTKPFRFGNGAVKVSESYVRVPQRLGNQLVLLGLYTIDAERVPILIGMRTLERLGAIIDVPGRWLVLSNIDPTVKIPLGKSRAGHLLIDLTRDWLDTSLPLSDEVQTAYMVQPLQPSVTDVCERFDRSEVEVQSTSCTVADTWVVTRVEEQEPELDSNEPDPAFVVQAHHDTAHAVAEVDQVMRDRILRQLANPRAQPANVLLSHGAQEGEERSTEHPSDQCFHGEVRLHEDRTCQAQRSSSDRTSMLGGTHRGQARPRISDREQPSCNMDGMRVLRPSSHVHTSLRKPRSQSESRTSGEGCESPDRGEEAGVWKPRSSGSQDRSGRGREILGVAPGDHQEAERGMDQDPRQEERQPPPGTRKFTIGPRTIGPSASGIVFDAFSSTKAWQQGLWKEPGPHHGRDLQSQDASSRGDPGGVGTSGGRDSKLGGSDTTHIPSLGMCEKGAKVSQNSGQGSSARLEDYEPEDADAKPNTVKKALLKQSASSFTPGNLPKPRKRKAEDDQDDLGDGQKLTSEESAFLVNEAENYTGELEELFASIKASASRTPFKVLELCCEAESGITSAVEALGGIGIRCGLHNGCDLNKNAGYNKVVSLLQDEKPDLVWVALPCGPTSQIQELNMLTPEGYQKIQEKVRKSKRLASRAVSIMEMQAASGRDVCQGWPRHNKGWKFQVISNFWRKRDTFEAFVDGCAYGLRVEEGFIKKPWRIKSTNKMVWQLQRLCQCEAPHVPCEGGTLTHLSAFYPKAMCKQVARMAQKISEEKDIMAMTVVDSPDNDLDTLKAFTEQEVNRVAKELLNLHKKLGHPSRQVFVKMLRDRGASSMVRTIASNMHCMDCEEASIPPARRVVTLEQATQLWEVVQLDNMEITVGDTTYHFQVLIDEASAYGAASFMFSHPASESRCPTGQEVLQYLHQGWLQHFGFPQSIKLDREGAHRSRVLDEWAESHGVELIGVPAECHGHMGNVERLIGTLKRKLAAYLRSSSAPPEMAVLAMIAAHNTMVNQGGYSPMQWVFGRNPTASDRLHDGPDLPYWAGMTSEEKMRQQLQVRLDAEQRHRELMLNDKINQARNSRMSNHTSFHPGDLVFYKRFQPPQDKQQRSHIPLDVPRRRVARWYGPSRVLALETKVSYDGYVRQPRQIAWLIAAGRLKRVSTAQLRFASERERVIAESSTPLATPWTFGDLSRLINKGEYDNMEMSEKQLRRDEEKKRAGPIASSSAMVPTGQQKRLLEEDVEEDDTMSTGHGENKIPRMEDGEPETIEIPDEELESDGYSPSVMDTPDETLDIDDLLHNPAHLPLPPSQQGPLFQHEPFVQARRRHEQLERPHHVQRMEYLKREDELLPAEEQIHYLDANCQIPAGDFAELIFAVTLPEPRSETEWRSIVKDPSRFIAKKVAKGVEVSWKKLNEQQRQAMTEAKQLEISEWLASKVCEKAIGPIPRERLMSMRWVLTFKATDTPGTMKAKARLVVLGFTDPDVGLVDVRSPTLSRRGRQLIMQQVTHKNWGFLKADAKAAFLQGAATQGARNIYGRPVRELQEALNMKEHEAVRFLKAAYGITVAPRDFYLYVAGILDRLGLERLQTEPCIWRLRAPNPSSQELRTIGVVGAHVDDFLLCGNEDHPAWTSFLEQFHKSMRWSPWETPPLTHCGVQIEAVFHNGLPGWRLHQSEFCEGINQVEEDGKTKELTENERHQCRAVLGAAQWRVFQTAPHHAAKLSHLQSLLPKADRGIIADINKFVREIYGQRDVGLHTYNLRADRDEDLIAVGWSDAALANRVDLSSTGGMIIGFVHRKMLEQGLRGHVNVISWGSSKLRRVCRSSLAAETQALAEAEQELMMVRLMWRELLGDAVDLANPHVTCRRTTGVLVTDAKALYDAAQQGDLPSFSMKEKYTALELLHLTQNMDRQETILRWCNSDAQLADGMTKLQAQDRIRKFLTDDQVWNLHYDENFTSAKRLKSANSRRTSTEPAEPLKDPTWLDLVQDAKYVTTGHVSKSASVVNFTSAEQVGHMPLHPGSITGAPSANNGF